MIDVVMKIKSASQRTVLYLWVCGCKCRN